MPGASEVFFFKGIPANVVNILLVVTGILGGGYMYIYILYLFIYLSIYLFIYLFVYLFQYAYARSLDNSKLFWSYPPRSNPSAS